MKTQTPLHFSLATLFCFYFYSAFATAQDSQLPDVDVELIEQLGNLNEDQELLQAAMDAYSKNKNAKPGNNQNSEPEPKPSVTAPILPGKKAGYQ